MIMQVIGVELKKGEFTDPNTQKTISYDNIFIYALKPNVYSTSSCFGSGKCPVTVKLKNDVDLVSAVFGSRIASGDLEAMIGKDYDFFYNEKGKIDRIISSDIKKG